MKSASEMLKDEDNKDLLEMAYAEINETEDKIMELEKEIAKLQIERDLQMRMITGLQF
jgi:protein subunit release factor A